MIRILEWLLDLKDIRLGRDAPLRLAWNTHIEAWMLACFAIIALVWVVAIYRKERASLARRTVLAGIRCVVIALVVAVICQPSIVLQRNRVEPAYVAVVLDRSESMATQELYEDSALATQLVQGVGLSNTGDLSRYSRLGLLKAMLQSDGAAPLKALLQRNAMQVSAFAGHAETRAWTADPASVGAMVRAIESITADGTRTDLAGAISGVIEGASGRRLAAIVLGSDGQSTESTSLRDALDLARGRQIPIFPIRIGVPVRPKDVAVGPIRAESSVFVRDVVAVEVPLSARGLAGPTTVRANLLDKASETVIDAQDVLLGPERRNVTIELHARPTRPGRVRYRVEVTPLEGERITENNSDRVEISVVDSKLRVLYVDGYPRYEYRYLKNALVREESIEISVLLIDADERFVQEGTDPIRRFPETPEALNQYDVVLFGDVDPRSGWLTLAQMNMLLDFVGNEGGGFGLIAGERAAPQRFLGTPLERLIPVRIDPEFLGRYPDPLTVGYRLQLTPEGRRSRIFRAAPPTGRDTGISSSDTNPFESLPELFWVARTLGPKPGASVLAEHPTMSLLTEQQVGTRRMPIVVTGRYGAGKIFFQGTDDTWRWRRKNGELLHDTYWVQVVRELMRGDRLIQSRRYIIRTEGRDFEYGAPIHVSVDVSDERILADHPDVIRISVFETVDRPEGGMSGSLEPSLVAHFDAKHLGNASKRYDGSYLPAHPGSFVISAEGIARAGAGAGASVAVRVERPNLESRHPEANHLILERIAEATGGHVVEPDKLAEVFAGIRDRSVRIPDDVTEPLWDSRLVLILFGLTITTEWVLRKRFGML